MSTADKASLGPRRESVATPDASWQLLPSCHLCRILAGGKGEWR